jgi:DNA-binding FadR family transcriptional regulator
MTNFVRIGIHVSQNLSEQPIAFNKVRRGSIVEEIIELFKEKLMAGELRPGERLPSEKQLTEQLGVGRTALREAIRMMSALGVIDVRQGEGSYITNDPSSSLLDPLVFAVLLKTGANQDLLELRTTLQIAYCELAAEKASQEDLVRIEQAAQEFEEISRSNMLDTDRLTDADLNFHYLIIESTHNPLVAKICKTVEYLFFTSIRSTISTEEGLSWGIKGHRNILQAIKDKDREVIHKAVVHSLERWKLSLEGADRQNFPQRETGT